MDNLNRVEKIARLVDRLYTEVYGHDVNGRKIKFTGASAIGVQKAYNYALEQLQKETEQSGLEAIKFLEEETGIIEQKARRALKLNEIKKGHIRLKADERVKALNGKTLDVRNLEKATGELLEKMNVNSVEADNIEIPVPVQEEPKAEIPVATQEDVFTPQAREELESKIRDVVQTEQEVTFDVKEEMDIPRVHHSSFSKVNLDLPTEDIVAYEPELAEAKVDINEDIFAKREAVTITDPAEKEEDSVLEPMINEEVKFEPRADIQIVTPREEMKQPEVEFEKSEPIVNMEMDEESEDYSVDELARMIEEEAALLAQESKAREAAAKEAARIAREAEEKRTAAEKEKERVAQLEKKASVDMKERLKAIREEAIRVQQETKGIQENIREGQKTIDESNQVISQTSKKEQAINEMLTSVNAEKTEAPKNVISFSDNREMSAGRGRGRAA